jgi:hypothetical protein
VAFFGNRIHISGKNKETLENAIRSLNLPENSSMEITPSLEDVFIHLVAKEKSTV